MIKECLYCGKKFNAKPGGKKYCTYAHFVYNHWNNKDRAREIIERYEKSNVLPLLKSVQPKEEIDR